MVDQKPIHGDAVGASEERFPFVAVQVEGEPFGPGDVGGAAAGLEDLLHEGFGRFVDDALDGVVAERAGFLGRAGPRVPDEVGEPVSNGRSD